MNSEQVVRLENTKVQIDAVRRLIANSEEIPTSMKVKLNNELKSMKKNLIKVYAASRIPRD